MEDERIARALNLLGENADLFSSDHEGLLDLIGEYFDDHAPERKLRPSLLSHPAIIITLHEYSHQDAWHKHNKNTIIISDDDALETVENHELIIDEDPEDSDYEEGTTQTADNIVLDSLASGALSEVCEVMGVGR